MISRLKNKEENLLRELIIELEFPPSESCLNFNGKFKINNENPLNSIKNFIKDFEDEGYFLTFSRHFNLIFLLKSQNSEPLEESEGEVSPLSPPLKSRLLNKEEEEKKLNNEKIFKLDECVICLNNPPMFCFVIVGICAYT